MEAGDRGDQIDKGHGGGDSNFPEWFWQMREKDTFDRESRLVTGWEQMKVINLMVQLGDLKKPGRSGEIKDGERIEEEIKKELDLYFEMAVGAGQDNVISVANMVERLAEPSPYLAQSETHYFENVDKGLLSLARYFKQEVPEAVLPWFRAFDETLSQQQGILNVLLGAGATTGGYYDALRAMGDTLIDRQRFHTNMGDFRSGLANEDPGVTVPLPDEIKKHIEGTFAEKEPRKEQTRMVDDARIIINATASVAQEDIIDGVLYKGERRTSFMELSSNKGRFIKLLFGDVNEKNWIVFKAKGWDGAERSITTPKEIDLWYADSDKLGAREKWISKMLAVLEWKDRNTGLGIWDSLDRMDNEKVLSVAMDINQKANEIKGRIGDKISNSSFSRGAAKLANLVWIETDKAFLISGRLGWKFKYGIDKDGVVRRFKKSGGIYKAYDNFYGTYPWEKYLDYKAGWRSTSQFFIASSDWMRKEKKKHRPDWMPPIHEWLAKDSRMKKIWDTLFDPRFKEFRARRLAGKIENPEAYEKALKEARNFADLDPEIASYLHENAYAYVTAYKNVHGELLALPMFLPKELEFINLWHNIQIENEDGSSESVFEKWQRGVKPSAIDYSQINFEALDRMWVGGNMLVRFLKLWIDPYEADRDPFLAGFFKSAGNQSVTELAKRIFLTFRDVPKAYQKMFAAIIPQSIALYEAHHCGLIGSGLGTPDAEEIMKKWHFRMAKWKRAFMWQPNIIYEDDNVFMEREEILKDWEGIKNLGNDCALILVTHKMAIERIAQAVYSADKDSLTRPFNDMLRIYDDEYLGGALNPEGDEPPLKDNRVRSIQFELVSEDDIEKKFFGRE